MADKKHESMNASNEATNNDTFEIHDEEINVEEIMQQIKENIRKRRDDGIKNDQLDALIKGDPEESSVSDEKNLVDFIISNWDIRPEYCISSHRPIIGKALVFGRRMINEEVRRYIDLIVGKQTEFNACVVSLLDNYIKNYDARMGRTEAEFNRKIENKAWLINVLDKKAEKELENPSLLEIKEDDRNYFLFEEKFRGSIENIRRRQSIYLEYFKNCQNVLDIGCGRGEFLSLLKEANIYAKGIDINEEMVLYCKKNDLDVYQGEALSYLRQLENDSLDGIFCGQVVEHLQPKELINLIKLCHDKMKREAYFIAETINPLCLSVFSSAFYLDLSHVKPIHPETIKFLLESVGFENIQFKFFSQFPEEIKLQKLKVNDKMSVDEKRNIETVNENLEKLNSLLYGFQDYAIIAKKP